MNMIPSSPAMEALLEIAADVLRRQLPEHNLCLADGHGRDLGDGIAVDLQDQRVRGVLANLVSVLDAEIREQVEREEAAAIQGMFDAVRMQAEQEKKDNG